MTENIQDYSYEKHFANGDFVLINPQGIAGNSSLKQKRVDNMTKAVYFDGKFYPLSIAMGAGICDEKQNGGPKTTRFEINPNLKERILSSCSPII